MKRLIKSSLCGIIAAMSLTSMSYAEGLARVDVQQVLGRLPQIAIIQQKIESEFAGEIEKVKKLESDIKYNIDKLQREGQTLSEAQTTEIRNSIQTMRKEYESLAQPLETNLRRRQNEERNKILALILQTIEKVAKDKEYDAVLHQSAIAYDSGLADLTEQVTDTVSKLK